MKINKAQLIAGRPVKEVRDAFRKLGRYTSKKEIAAIFGLSGTAGDALVQQLLREGYLEEHQDRRHLETTKKALRLANVRFVKRINKEQAAQILTAFLSRVHQINQRDELTHMVDEVRIFGSYLEDVPDVGDLDIAISLGHRLRPGESLEDWSRRCLARAKASGRSFGTFHDRAFYSQHEIKLILKDRNPYISLHDMGHFDSFPDSRYQVLFKAAT